VRDHAGMSYEPAEHRYDAMPYRRCGRSGLQLPAISLGLWNNFGDDRPLERQREILRRAFDLGVCHFDLANNYGPAARLRGVNFGRILREDLAPWRDELVISTKAGYDMWPGPYGEWGSRKYLLASLDQSLKRMGLDYVDIFYSHRLDPETPLEETLGALDTAVRQGKALYAGISSYRASGPRRPCASWASSGRRCSSTSRPTRCSTAGSRKTCWTCSRRTASAASPSPRSPRGMLTDRYLDGVPEDSRAAKGVFLTEDMLTAERLEHVRALNAIAQERGQSLAQMAVAWVLRDPRVTSALVGASSVEQLEQTLGALEALDFTPDELAAIDGHAVDAGINIWEASSRE
jgi:L-glyceraldehyde 3-phosphate reductase